LLSAQGVIDDDVWGVDLAPLRGLTQLQHLELPVGTTEYAAADAETDVAALTASSQLTYLNIVGMVEQQHYSRKFPAGRQLPKLKELRATMGVLGSAEDAEGLVRCCPNLEHLDVGIGECVGFAILVKCCVGSAYGSASEVAPGGQAS
jgi:hypothetical protein